MCRLNTDSYPHLPLPCVYNLACKHEAQRKGRRGLHSIRDYISLWTAIAAGMLRTKMLPAGYFDDEGFFEPHVRQRSTNLLYMHLSGPST